MRAVRWMVGAAATCVVLFAPAASAMAATPALTLTPGFGPPGVSVTVKGSGFGATEAVDVYFDSTDMVVAATSSTGASSTSFTVPAATPTGTHWVSAVGRASGLSAQHSFGLSDTVQMVGKGQLGWSHEFADNTASVSANFSSLGGSGFQVSSAPIGRDAALVGVDADFQVSGWPVAIFAGYGGAFSGSSNTQAFTAGLRFNW